MNRPTALALVGAVFLLVAAAVPLVGLATGQWDTDYVYRVETGDSYCADVVYESPDVEGTAGFRVDYENLSATGRRHFDRARADGRYVVDNQADVAPDFQYTDDHVAPGEGCYAVSSEGETYALRTSRDSQRVGPVTGRWPVLVGGLLFVVGAASLTAGVGLMVKQRLE